MGNNVKNLKATTTMAKDPELAQKLWNFSMSLTHPQAQSEAQTEAQPQTQPNWYFMRVLYTVQDKLGAK